MIAKELHRREKNLEENYMDYSEHNRVVVDLDIPKFLYIV